MSSGPSSRPSSSNESIFKSSLSSASSLMALQLFSRLFTFVLNQALFRLTSPSAFGAAAIQFELILSTILFMSREGVRNALLRVKSRTPRTMNLAFLPIVLGCPLALATTYLYAQVASGEMKAQPGFRAAIGVYTLAALVELLSEPMHNVAMAELRTGVRVRAEGLGITSKSVVTLLILLWDARREDQGRLALMAFAAGQLAYGTVVLLVYVATFGRTYLWPQASPSTTAKSFNYVDSDLLRLSMTMTSQSLVKHFLTEGDKLILSWFSPLQDQGGYAIAVNYGSLIARIVFQPIEESLRVFFSKTLPSNAKGPSNPQALKAAADALLSLLSIQAAFSVVLVVFGTAYLPILLPILLPHQFLATSAPKVLAAWVWYIPVLAFNGGLEAFLSSVTTPQDLNKQSRWMVGFSVIYILAAVSFYRLDLRDASLVYANILNLSARIAYCLRFIRQYFTRRGAPQFFRWRNAIPAWQFWLASVFSASLLWVSEHRQGVSGIVETRGRTALLDISVLIHIALGAILAVLCLLTWWFTSGRTLAMPGRTKIE